MTLPGEHIAQLKAEIARAFADVAYPGDDNIAQESGSEGTYMAEHFRGKHWSEITHEDTRLGSLSFLTDEGLLFYLPAFLDAAIDDHAEMLQELLLDLCPVRPQEWSTPEEAKKFTTLREWERRRFARFSPAQRRAIYAFLEWVRDAQGHRFYTEPLRHPALVGALAYWGEGS